MGLEVNINISYLKIIASLFLLKNNYSRTGTCVYSWREPTDATLYCISSDYQYTMITGTKFNCKAVLWDQRQKNYVQVSTVVFLIRYSI